MYISIRLHSSNSVRELDSDRVFPGKRKNIPLCIKAEQSPVCRVVPYAIERLSRGTSAWNGPVTRVHTLRVVVWPLKPSICHPQILWFTRGIWDNIDGESLRRNGRIINPARTGAKGASRTDGRARVPAVHIVGLANPWPGDVGCL